MLKSLSYTQSSEWWNHCLIYLFIPQENLCSELGGYRKEFSFPYIPSGLFRGKSEQVYIYFGCLVFSAEINLETGVYRANWFQMNSDLQLIDEV